MAFLYQSEDNPDLNYFVCTLGQAAAINNGHSQPFKTINDFIDHQARQFPTRPAVGFPVPRKDGGEQWGQTVYSKSPLFLMHDVFLEGGHLASCSLSFGIQMRQIASQASCDA